MPAAWRFTAIALSYAFVKYIVKYGQRQLHTHVLRTQFENNQQLHIPVVEIDHFSPIGETIFFFKHLFSRFMSISVNST